MFCSIKMYLMYEVWLSALISQKRSNEMLLWVSLPRLTTGKCGVQSKASLSIITSFALAAFSWLVYLSDVPIIVYCRGGQVDNCHTDSMTFICQAFVHRVCFLEPLPLKVKALCSFKTSRNHLLTDAALHLRTPTSTAPLWNLKTHMLDKCLPSNCDHVTMTLVLQHSKWYWLFIHQSLVCLLSINTLWECSKSQLNR